MIDKRTNEEFARKVIRPFGQTTHRDIRNEIEAIAAICSREGHKNIITILHYGQLPHHDYHYIDMPLCDLNLNDYIHGSRPVFNIESENQYPQSANIVFVEKECVLRMKMQNTWTILSHIADGLKYIHEKGFAHRDLKPRNGILNI